MTNRPRTRPAEERRDDLMNAAERLFLAQSVSATTIEQITTAAGVAKGSFYLHFTAKEDVVVALRQRFVARVGEAITAALDRVDTSDWPGRLGAWARACVEAYAASSSLHDIVFREMPAADGRGLIDNPLIDDLTALLAGGTAAGAWSVADPRFTAIFLFNAIHGVTLATDEADPTHRRLIDHCLRLVGVA